jgi:hypothetical protein
LANTADKKAVVNEHVINENCIDADIRKYLNEPSLASFDPQTNNDILEFFQVNKKQLPSLTSVVRFILHFE